MKPGPLVLQPTPTHAATQPPHREAHAWATGLCSSHPGLPHRRGLSGEGEGGERNTDGEHNLCWLLGPHSTLISTLQGRNYPPCLELRHLNIRKVKELYRGQKAELGLDLETSCLLRAELAPLQSLSLLSPLQANAHSLFEPLKFPLLIRTMELGLSTEGPS